MIKKLTEFVQNNLFKTLGVPTVLSGVTFLSNVAQSLSDGQLSHSELQGLISSTSGLETLMMIVIMLIMKLKK